MEKKIEIVFEDVDLLVLNKPAGFVSTTEGRQEKNPTVEDWLPGKVEAGLPRNGVLHRLDKGTSGLLLVAKNMKSLVEMKKIFLTRKIKKIYVALVAGEVSYEGVVEVPIGRTRFAKFGVTIGGKMARSEFRLLKKYERLGKKYSLIEVDLKSGRTHQIRVHLSYLGWPLVGDYLYGGERLKIDRPFLHASRLEFKKHKFFCDLPFELKEVLNEYEEI
jgi:23S rRNA pseudouridine1911/1915/1917 synthase